MESLSTGRTATGRMVASGLGPLASTLLLLLAACARVPHPAAPAAIQAPALSAPDGTPKASTSTTPITIDIAVRSKRHQPVADLQAPELTVLDGGAPVQLTSLQRVDPATGPPRLINFVFDPLNPKAARTARRMAERVLAVIPDTGYSLAVLRVDARLRLLQGYTHDFHLTEAALTDATPFTSSPSTLASTSAENDLFQAVRRDALNSGATGRAERKVLFSALQQSQQIVEDRHSYPSLAALQALVFSNRLLPGRKFLFYFTAGFASASDAYERLQSIVSLANRAGVTIYVIDVGSLAASMGSEMQAAQASQFLGTGGASGNLSAFGVGKGTSSSAPVGLQTVLAHEASGFAFGEIRSDESPVLALAAGTGGSYLTAETGLQTQLLHIHEDLTSWYQASWTPPFERFDGQFRPVEIHSSRKDLTVRARSGYFAVPPEDSGVLPFEVPLFRILAEPTPPSDLAMQAGILHLGPSPDGNAAEVVVQVPVSQLQTHDDGNTHLTSVDAAIVAVIKDSKGIVLQRFGEHFPLREAPSMFRDAGQTLTLERSFSAQPGVYTLETVAMDLTDKRAGVQRTQFTLQAPPAGPVLSDVALVQRVEPVEEDTRDLEPMHCADGRVVPNLASDLPPGTNSLSFFFLLHPVAGSQHQPDLRMQILREGRVLTDAPMRLHPVSGGGASVPFLASLHATAFVPGKYMVKVLLTQDGSTVTSSADFRVAGISSASNTLASADTAALDSPSPDTSFVIAPLPHPIPPPTANEVHAMIEDTGSRSLAWSDSLRNFLCLEVTDHFVNAPAEHDWRHKATLIEMMRYVDHEQTRTVLLLNGEPSTVQPDRLEFAHSNGEFGAMFHIIFDPSAHTDFTWKQASFLDGQPVQVFAFQVPRANSGFYLSDRDNHTHAVAFHGLLFLDPLTRSVRRVTIAAEDIPRDLAIHASSMSVDYAFVSMQNHDFLLPIRGSVNLQETGKQPVLNQFEFHNYHRFGSQARIHAKEEHDPVAGGPPRPR